MRKVCSLFLVMTMVLSSVTGYAQGVSLPAVGAMVQPSEAFSPMVLRGMVLSPDKPLTFDFIVDQGNEILADQDFRITAQRLINYFFASMTVPEGDLWVNLSPVEKDRVLTDEMARTELGRDLLAQDYLLKQLAASLIYPEGKTGQAFWKRIYNEAHEKFGTVEIPVDTFNKVWIVPSTASVHESEGRVYVTDARMKVMLEADYLAANDTRDLTEDGAFGCQVSGVGCPSAELSKQILREVIVPVIQEEINTGKNFALLRQVFYSLVLSKWYKKAFAESALKKAYADHNKVAGVDVSDPALKEKVYQQYLEAYRKGVFNYIKEETDRLTNEPVPRQYFSGGFSDGAMAFVDAAEGTVDPKGHALVTVEASFADDDALFLKRELDQVHAGLVQTLQARGVPGIDRATMRGVVTAMGVRDVVEVPYGDEVPAGSFLVSPSGWRRIYRDGEVFVQEGVGVFDVRLDDGRRFYVTTQDAAMSADKSRGAIKRFVASLARASLLLGTGALAEEIRVSNFHAVREAGGKTGVSLTIEAVGSASPRIEAVMPVQVVLENGMRVIYEDLAVARGTNNTFEVVIPGSQIQTYPWYADRAFFAAYGTTQEVFDVADTLPSTGDLEPEVALAEVQSGEATIKNVFIGKNKVSLGFSNNSVLKVRPGWLEFIVSKRTLSAHGAFGPVDIDVFDKERLARLLAAFDKEKNKDTDSAMSEARATAFGALLVGASLTLGIGASAEEIKVTKFDLVPEADGRSGVSMTVEAFGSASPRIEAVMPVQVVLENGMRVIYEDLEVARGTNNT
ncbi:MAG: hypothetical protein GX606_04190, partial [Elusimicrobia bacterium]|nr:hypothetical protein [Elusimicrobiota bacterium]